MCKNPSMKKILILCALVLVGCNSINIKPNSLNKSETIAAFDRGGYTMKFAAKQELEKRGFKVIIGKTKAMMTAGNDNDYELLDTMGARYVLKTYEEKERFNPYCMFNGWWWWRFNVSIADQKTGEELLAWSGRGCANANLRRLNRLITQVEK